MEKQVLILTSVASMIDQFIMPNIELLIEMEHKVHVACNFKEGNTCSDGRIKILKNKLLKLGVSYHQIDFKRDIKKTLDNKKAYNQVRNLMKKTRYEFVHCHSPIGGVCGRLAARESRKKGTKVIYTAHGFHFYKGAPLKNWLFYYPVEYFLSKYTDVLITINKEDYNRVNNKFVAKKVEYIPGVGIDVSKLNNLDINKLNKRRELDIPEDAIVLLSVGELNKNKNHEIIIKAISELKDSNIYYVICGLGQMKDHLVKLSKKLGLERQIIIAGFRNDIAEIYKASDIFCFPSYREGLPVALMEAMSAGLPVVCSGIRGNVDLIVDNKGGYLINPSDFNRFAKSLVKLTKSKKLRETFGESNVNIIQKYDINIVLETIKKIYRDLDLNKC